MMKTRTTWKQLAAADVGQRGQPGSPASQIVCDIQRRGVPGSTGVRYEATGEVRTGCNQGYFCEDYRYGPWRGRGDTAAEAVAAMLGIVPATHLDDMRRASQEALIEAEDFEHDEADSNDDTPPNHRHR